jgi:hypothetical protein
MDLPAEALDEMFRIGFGATPVEEAEEDDHVVACFGCGSGDIIAIHSDGDAVCQCCGLVQQSSIPDDTPEWRNDADDGIAGDKSRVGGPSNPLFTSCNMSTMITKRGKSRRMAVIHERLSMSYRDRALYKTFKEITHVCTEKMNLSQSVIEWAKEMYRDIKDQKITRGENHRALIVCCVYYASKLDRVNSATRPKEFFCSAFQLDKSSFTHSSKIFLDLVQDRPYFEKIMEESCNRGIISSTVGRLPIGDRRTFFKYVNAIEDCYDYVRANGDGITDSKTPNAIISALAYVVAEQMGLKLSKVDIKNGCNISTLTLNKTIALITPILSDKSTT